VIDWTTVAFQIVNFLVLLFLLRKFLYGRVIEAMDAREARIAAQLAKADAEKQQAERLSEKLRQETDELAARRDQLLAEAKADADAQRRELLGKARTEVDRARAQWFDAVQREKEGFLHDLRQRVSMQSLAIARRALDDLAGADLEGRLLDSFLEELNGLDDAERMRFAESIRETEEGKRHVVVRSAFDLPDEAQRRLTEAVHARIADGLDVGFETSADLIAGIELRAGGAKLAWSFEHYLASLEEEFAAAFETPPEPPAAAASSRGSTRQDAASAKEEAKAES